jgi:hypothetical protein
MTSLFRTVLVMAFAAACVFGARELRRWATEPDLLNAKQRRLRSGALFFMLATVAMVFGGTFLYEPPGSIAGMTAAQKVAKLHFLEYWTATALLALPLVVMAMLDVKETVNRAREERKAVIRKSLHRE